MMGNMGNIAELLAADSELLNELSEIATTSQLQSVCHRPFILLATYRRSAIRLIVTRAITLVIDHIPPIRRIT